MPDFTLDLSKLDDAERADLPAATYFTLECLDDYILASISDATTFSVHMGLPGRPDRRHAWKYDTFTEALQALRVLKKSHPGAGMWLSCEEILEEIRGADVVRGVVIARASVDPSDFEDEWRVFAANIAWAEAKGEPVVLDQFAGFDIQEVAKLL